jgi:hypothetical protein
VQAILQHRQFVALAATSVTELDLPFDPKWAADRMKSGAMTRICGPNHHGEIKKREPQRLPQINASLKEKSARFPEHFYDTELSGDNGLC